MLSFYLRKVAKLAREGQLPQLLPFALSTATDLLFDLRNGVDTVGPLGVEDISADPTFLDHASGYTPAGTLPVKRFFRQAGLGGRGGFVDYGSGKGQVLLIAALSGFDRVVGIEYSAPLCSIASMNVDRLLATHPRVTRDMHVINKDAARYQVDPRDDTFFFFDPFDAVILGRCVEAIERSVTSDPREVTLIYVKRLVADWTPMDELGSLVLRDRYSTWGHHFSRYAIGAF